MSRVITLSRTYPSYHPKAGQPTWFVEMTLNWFWGQPNNAFHNVEEILKRYNPELYQVGGIDLFIESCNLDITDWKNHTIRAGHRWKAGDWFSPRVWSGKPYRSKMIQFAPDIQIKKTWDIDIHGTDWYLNGRHEYTTGWNVSKDTIANNDGLTPDDFYDWFTLSPDFKKKQDFFGQIICWNENIEY